MGEQNIVVIVTMIVTWVMGILAKNIKFISNNLIPIQNIVIGVIAAAIEWFITKDFNVAIATSGLLAGGVYDIFHNLGKIFSKGDG